MPSSDVKPKKLKNSLMSNVYASIVMANPEAYCLVLLEIYFTFSLSEKVVEVERNFSNYIILNF